MAIIGIDLGTTNSLGAVYRNGNVELIPNRYGSFLTPSVVSIDEEKNILVGEIARERLISSPETAVSSFKKDMGYEKKYRLGKRTFSPEELSSFVIRAIVDDAREYLQEEIGEVVISVPAYFNDKQRVATKKAGALAGVKTNRIINEPSAAAMASYFDTSSEQVFLIFDFGGGTLDISIVECFDTMVEILSVAGDNRLGGDDFHEIMVKAFLREHGISSRNVTDKEYAVLKKQAEICKRKLTDEKKAYMSPIVPRNSVLPCSRVKRFYTIKDDQQKIELNILQGEQAYAEDNLHLDKLTIPVPKAKKGEESIDVRFTYDINGILAVDVTVVSTGKTVTKIVSQNISEADLNKKIKELEKLKVHPKQVAENQLIIERLRALYEEAPCYLRENILEFLREYEKILEGQDSRRIRKYSNFLNRVIEQYSFVDPFEEEFLFEEYDDEAEDESGEAEDEFDFFSVGNGGSKWTS